VWQCNTDQLKFSTEMHDIDCCAPWLGLTSSSKSLKENALSYKSGVLYRQLSVTAWEVRLLILQQASAQRCFWNALSHHVNKQVLNSQGRLSWHVQNRTAVYSAIDKSVGAQLETLSNSVAAATLHAYGSE